jgi:hypothetical protein
MLKLHVGQELIRDLLFLKTDIISSVIEIFNLLKKKERPPISGWPVPYK